MNNLTRVDAAHGGELGVHVVDFVAVTGEMRQVGVVKAASDIT